MDFSWALVETLSENGVAIVIRKNFERFPVFDEGEKCKQGGVEFMIDLKRTLLKLNITYKPFDLDL